MRPNWHANACCRSYLGLPKVLLKIDENLPIEVAAVLRDAGHDAMTVLDQGMVGEPDSKLAAICKTEGRIMVTLDLDFSDIRAYPPSEYPGIVVIRPRSQAKPMVLTLAAQLLHFLADETLGNKLWILQDNGLRIRD